MISVVILHIYVQYSNSMVVHICAVWQPCLFWGICQDGRLQFAEYIYGDCSFKSLLVWLIYWCNPPVYSLIESTD